MDSSPLRYAAVPDSEDGDAVGARSSSTDAVELQPPRAPDAPAFRLTVKTLTGQQIPVALPLPPGADPAAAAGALRVDELKAEIVRAADIPADFQR